jgi:trk system potassium uptake protein TrkH
MFARVTRPLANALLWLGLLGFAAFALLDLETAPVSTVSRIVIVTLALIGVFGDLPVTLRDAAGVTGSRLRGASLGAIIAIVVAIAMDWSRSTTDAWLEPATLLAPALAMVLSTRAERSRWALPPLALAGIGCGLAAAGAALWFSGFQTAGALIAGAFPVVVFFSLPPASVEFGRDVSWTELLLIQPTRFLVATFLATGLLGGLLLTAPSSATPDHTVSLVDGMFISFSATCVTGLATVDVPTTFSLLGTVVIAVLIQIGGLGIMAFSTAGMILLGQRMSLRQEGAAAQLLGSEGRSTLRAALWRMVIVTFVAEGIGAVILTAAFLADGDTLFQALGRGVFTSISAYCNAGFALQSDSLIGYADDPLILHTIAALIIIGGLGPAVIAARRTARGRRESSLYVRIAQGMTLVLLIIPTILIAALEWNASFSSLAAVDKVHNAWFQSVTTRTAGFNSVDISTMAPASRSLILALMIVGGSPGSTAGGLKTTTLFVIGAAVVAAVRERSEVRVGGWVISRKTVAQAYAITALYFACAILAVIALQLTQQIAEASLIFETISALGTVGLSIGATTQLDGLGKVIIILCMFVGRVGPLALLMAFSWQQPSEPWSRPEQDLPVG